ncbi:MAG: DUF4339 domain-containing protein, partial [Fimbriiglobus sp.]
MLSEWYYIQKDRRHGPVTEDAIRQLIRAGYLRPNDLIWRSGDPAWEQVSRFDELLADSRS